MKKIKTGHWGSIALILASLLWGIEFVVEKDILFHYGANWSNTIRFFVASIVFLILWQDKFKSSSSSDWKRGFLSGVSMGIGYSFQTMGLQHISPGVNAFLCSAYIVMIPFLSWYFEKKKPNVFVVLSVVITFVGVIFLSNNDFVISEISIGLGEGLTLVGAIFYALGIVLCENHAKGMDTKLLAGIQCIATLLVALIVALIFEPVPNYVDTIIVIEFIYLIVFATMITQVLFTYGMQYVDSNKAGIIFLFESISAMILGWIFMRDQIIATQIIGALIIIISIIVNSKSTV